jgi:nitrogen regulatory protein PII
MVQSDLNQKKGGIMKMFLIIYCEAVDEAVIAALKEAGIHGYTKMVEARGEGTETEPKLGTHCWPGKNNVLLMAVADDEVAGIRGCVRSLQQEHPRGGVRSFLVPLEETL